MAWVLACSRSEGADRLVLLAIANHADAEGTNAYPNAMLIAEEARVGRATVFRAVQRLVGRGELVRESGGGRGHPNRYSVALKPSHEKGSQGSQCETDSAEKGSHLRVETVSSAQIKGLTGDTRTVLNRPEPKTAIANSVGSQPPSQKRDGLAARCPSCGNLTFDCLCDRGPLIRDPHRR